MSADRPNRPFDPRVICALDVPTTDEARALVERIGDAVGFYKVGLQLFASDGMGLAGEQPAAPEAAPETPPAAGAVPEPQASAVTN